jgi:hypothetical protein
VRWWSANITSHSRQPGCFLFRRGRHLTKEAAMLRNLDLLDLFLLAGSIVYFGLLVLRRI